MSAPSTDDPRVMRLLAFRSLACPYCGYDLTGATSATCSECGVRLRLGSFMHPERCDSSHLRNWLTMGLVGVTVGTGVWLLISFPLMLDSEYRMLLLACFLALLGAEAWLLWLAIFKPRLMWDRHSLRRLSLAICAAIFVLCGLMYTFSQAMFMWANA